MNNINVFLRVRQNTCSNKIESIPFFSPQHLRIESQLISKLLGFKKQTFFVDHEFQADLSGIAHEVNQIAEGDFNKIALSDCSLFLTSEKCVNAVLSSHFHFNVFIIRHEGDFNINGKEIPCDCDHCLLNSLSTADIPYRFLTKPYSDYHDGNQYRVLVYSHQQSQDGSPIIEPELSGCRKKPPILNQKFTSSVGSMLSAVQIKNEAYESYQSIGSPKYFCAPMIGQSELAFRMFLKEWAGVHICYTPMIISHLFLQNEEYRNELFTTCKEDRPLVVQFEANDPAMLLMAAKQVEDHCDAIDINFGCPQPTGRRNHYGAWLMEDWQRVYQLIHTLKINLKKPVWSKIRIFPDVDLTIEYAKMIEQAGASLLAVHGRLRKCHMNDEPADRMQIRCVKEALNIPVVANGGITSLFDANECLRFTGCDGVMAASNILRDPFLFSVLKKSKKDIALLYLQYAIKYKALLRYAKPHVMQILDNLIDENTKHSIKICSSVDQLYNVVNNADILSELDITNPTPKESTFDTLFEFTTTS